MSGHEKFYIPHDDLQELKTAMDTLDTTMSVFNTNIETWSAAFLLPNTETFVTDGGSLAAGFESLTVIEEVFSADVDVYLMRARVILTCDEDIFRLYNSDIEIAIHHGATMVSVERFCEGIHPMLPLNAAENLFAGQRMFDLHEVRVPAGETVYGKAGGYNIPAATGVSMWIFYREEVTL